jgi:hypothetical protein
MYSRTHVLVQSPTCMVSQYAGLVVLAYHAGHCAGHPVDIQHNIQHDTQNKGKVPRGAVTHLDTSIAYGCVQSRRKETQLALQ